MWVIKNKFVGLLLICLVAINVNAQTIGTSDVLSVQTVMEWVRTNHPVAKQANLLTESADAELTATRGAFDPTFNWEASKKTFDGKNYYQYTNPELQLPTASPITIKTGLENNRGVFVNPENSGKLSYLGVEVPLGNGLLIDKRRAALQQAKLMQTQSRQDRLAQLNDLLLDAYAAYWRWAGAWEINQLLLQFAGNASNRLRLVKINWQNGDRAVMDTIEANAQLQQILLFQSEAAMKLTNAGIELSYFLWEANEQPFRLPEYVRPDANEFRGIPASSPLEELLATAMNLNPEIRSAALKVNSMEIDKKLKFQSMLPYFSVKANILNTDYAIFKGWDNNFIANNNRWGISFNMPLFLRQGRGDYKRAQIKLKESTLQLSAKRWQTENKIRYYYTEYSRLQDQLQLTDQVQNNFRQLLKNEELRFNQGESSLFLINSREMKWLESLQKQAELRVKFLTSTYQLQWATGTLR